MLVVGPAPAFPDEVAEVALKVDVTEDDSRGPRPFDRDMAEAMVAVLPARLVGTLAARLDGEATTLVDKAVKDGKVPVKVVGNPVEETTAAELEALRLDEIVSMDNDI